MKFEIKHKFSGSVLFSIETDNFRLAVEAAVNGGVDLRGADLRGADLYGADLRGAKIRDDITVSQQPIQIAGLTWDVVVWDNHMQIGCEFHTHADWAAFTDTQIVNLDGRSALKFWNTHKTTLLALCSAHAATAKKIEPEAA